MVARLIQEVDVLDAGRADDVRSALERQADEPDLDPVNGLHLGSRQDRLAGVLVDDIRREES